MDPQVINNFLLFVELYLCDEKGTGKTMLAKAVAHHTSASFIRVVGSEFVQKYLGEGPRMVRDVFRYFNTTIKLYFIQYNFI